MLNGAICKNRSANLEFDYLSKKAKCPYCGSQLYFKEQTTYVSNNYGVKNADIIDSMARSGDAFISFGEFDRAAEMFEKLCQAYSYDYRGYWG